MIKKYFISCVPRRTYETDYSAPSSFNDAELVEDDGAIPILPKMQKIMISLRITSRSNNGLGNRVYFKLG